MTILLSLAERRLRPELMDQPGLARADHARALNGLRRLNIASSASRQLWSVIARHARAAQGTRLRLLDIASGGGDIPLGLWRLAHRRGVDLQILGLDISGAACTEAAQRCRPAGKAITFQCTDVTTAALPKGFDVVTSSLFLHHLPWNQATALLRKMREAARLVVISDLRRSAAGYAVAQAACRLLTRSPIVRYDGRQSVASAFTLSEVRELCREAGMQDAVVRRAWPCRLMIIHNSD
jgi:2-polyprenyl-3-methyl-5-hydroxy-6-metoxy-1,4-benzoquinol methylase